MYSNTNNYNKVSKYASHELRAKNKLKLTGNILLGITKSQ